MATHGPCIVCGKKTAHGCTECGDGHICSAKCYKTPVAAAHRQSHLIAANFPGELPELKYGTVYEWFGILVTKSTWDAVRARPTKFSMVKQGRSSFNVFWPQDAQLLWCWILESVIDHIDITHSAIPEEGIDTIMNGVNSVEKHAVWKQGQPGNPLQVTLFLQYDPSFSQWLKSPGSQFNWDVFPFDQWWSCATLRNRYDSKNPNYIHTFVVNSARSILKSTLEELYSVDRAGVSRWEITFTEGGRKWTTTGLKPSKKYESLAQGKFYKPLVVDTYKVTEKQWVDAQFETPEQWHLKNTPVLIKDSLYRSFNQPKEFSTPLYNEFAPGMEQKMMQLDLFFGDINITSAGLETTSFSRRLTSEFSPSSMTVILGESQQGNQVFQVVMRPVIGREKSFFDLLQGCLEDINWAAQYFAKSKLKMELESETKEEPGFITSAVYDMFHWLEEGKIDEDKSYDHDLLYQYIWRSTEESESNAGPSVTEDEESDVITNFIWIQREPPPRPIEVQIQKVGVQQQPVPKQAPAPKQEPVVKKETIYISSGEDEDEDQPQLEEIQPEPVIRIVDSPPPQAFEDVMQVEPVPELVEIPPAPQQGQPSPRKRSGGPARSKPIVPLNEKNSVTGGIFEWFDIMVTANTMRIKKGFESSIKMDLDYESRESRHEQELVKRRRWIWCFLLSKMIKHIEIECPTLQEPIKFKNFGYTSTYWLPTKSKTPRVQIVLHNDPSVMGLFKRLRSKKEYGWSTFQAGVFWSCLTSQDRFDWKNPDTIHSKLYEFARTSLKPLVEELLLKRASQNLSVVYTMGKNQKWRKTNLIPADEPPGDRMDVIVFNPITYEDNDPDLDFAMWDWKETQVGVQDEWEQKDTLRFFKDALARAMTSPHELEPPSFSRDWMQASLAQKMMGMDLFFKKATVSTAAYEEDSMFFRVASRMFPRFQFKIEYDLEFKIELVMLPVKAGQDHMVDLIRPVLGDRDFFIRYLISSKFRGIDEEDVRLQKAVAALYEYLAEEDFAVDEDFTDKVQQLEVTITFEKSDDLEDIDSSMDEEGLALEAVIAANLSPPDKEEGEDPKPQPKAPKSKPKAAPSPNPNPNPPIFVQPPGVPPAVFRPPAPPALRPAPEVVVIPSGPKVAPVRPKVAPVQPQPVVVPVQPEPVLVPVEPVVVPIQPQPAAVVPVEPEPALVPIPMAAMPEPFVVPIVPQPEQQKKKKTKSKKKDKKKGKKSKKDKAPKEKKGASKQLMPGPQMEPIIVEGEIEQTITTMAKFRGPNARKLKAEMLKTMSGRSSAEWVKAWRHEKLALPALLLDSLFDIGIRTQESTGAMVYKIIPTEPSDLHWPVNAKPSVPLCLGIKLKGAETDLRKSLWMAYRKLVTSSKSAGLIDDQFKKAYWKNRFNLAHLTWMKLVNESFAEADKLSLGIFNFVLSELSQNASSISPEGTVSFFYLDETKQWKERRQFAGMFFIGKKALPTIDGKRKANNDDNPNPKHRKAITGTVEDVMRYFEEPSIAADLQTKYETMSAVEWVDAVDPVHGSCFLFDKLVKTASVLVEEPDKEDVHRYYQHIPLKSSQDSWDKNTRFALPLMMRFELTGTETTNRTKAWRAAKAAIEAGLPFFTKRAVPDLVRMYCQKRFDVPSKNFRWDQIPADMVTFFPAFASKIRKMAADPPTQAQAIFFKFEKVWKTAVSGVVYPNYVNGKFIGMPSPQRDETNEWLFDQKLRSYAAFNKLLENNGVKLWHLQDVDEDLVNMPGFKPIYFMTHLALSLLKSVVIATNSLIITVSPQKYAQIQQLQESFSFSFHRLVHARTQWIQFPDPDLFLTTDLIWKLMRSGVASELFEIKEKTLLTFTFHRDPKTREVFIHIQDQDDDQAKFSEQALSSIVATLPAFSTPSLLHKLIHPSIFTLSILQHPMVVMGSTGRQLLSPSLAQITNLQAAWRDERDMEYLFYLKETNPAVAMLLLMEATVGDMLGTQSRGGNGIFEFQPQTFGQYKTTVVVGDAPSIVVNLNSRWLKFAHGFKIQPPLSFTEFLVLHRGKYSLPFTRLRSAAVVLNALWTQVLNGTSILTEQSVTTLKIVGSAVYIGEETMPIKPLVMIARAEVQQEAATVETPIVYVGHERTQKSEHDFINIENRAGVLLLEHKQFPADFGYPRRQKGVKSNAKVLKQLLDNLIVCTEFWDVSCGNFTVMQRDERISVKGYHRPRKHDDWDLQIKFVIPPDSLERDQLLQMAKTGTLTWSSIGGMLNLPDSITLFTNKKSVQYFVHLICEKNVENIVYIYHQGTGRWAVISPDSPVHQLW